MRLICSVVSFLIIFLIKFSYGKCVAFYYWHNPPVELLYSFDVVVVDPDNVDKNFYINGIQTYNKKAKILAYVSVGEIEKYRKDFNKVKEEWLLGKNRVWESLVADIRNKDYQDFLLNRIKNIYKAGFDGIFLDTLDSYQIILENQKRKKEYEKALVSFIKNVKQTFPDKIIALNRGFEIYDEIKNYFDMFVVEDVFSRLSEDKERQKLLEKLKNIAKEKDVVVIEYVKPGEKQKAEKFIKQIKSYGFIPYISNLSLNIIGYSECTPEPRRALLLYNSDIQLSGKKDPSFSNVHRLAQTFLEYYGYVPDVFDINKGIPEGYLADRYKLIVVWIDEAPDPDKFFQWIKEKINSGIKVIFIDSFGFPLTKNFLSDLGIVYGKAESTDWKLDNQNSIKWKEIAPPTYKRDYYIYPKNGIPLFVLRNSSGQVHVPAAITKWGGYAVEGFFVRAIIEDFFVIDPFFFFEKTANVPITLIPDTTTESGRRLLFVHIDGDGFNQKTSINPDKYEYASEVIKEEIIKKFSIPHSVSIIEGEIAPWGAYPEDNHQKLESIAKDIFSMPNVEPASHSFSHPFDWYQIYYKEPFENGIYNLNIKNYRFNLKREIEGSIKYIESRLLNNKKKVKIFFWTGDCMPPVEALKLTYDLHVYNLNGGDTYITKEKPLLSLISPLGINKGKYFQVYAQVQNDNVFTEGFSYPYGYIKAIQTFELTDKERRLKPIDIYYHFFSGSKPASLKALKEVYNWAVKQEIIPIYATDFTKIALDSRNTTIKKLEDNIFVVNNNGDLRTLRVERKVYVDLVKSKGVAGYRYIKGKTYIALDGTGEYKVVLSKNKVYSPFNLISSNARVSKVDIVNNSFSIELSGYQPVELIAQIRPDCKLTFSPKNVQILQKNGITTIKTKNKRLKIDAECRN